MSNTNYNPEIGPKLPDPIKLRPEVLMHALFFVDHAEAKIIPFKPKEAPVTPIETAHADATANLENISNLDRARLRAIELAIPARKLLEDVSKAA